MWRILICISPLEKSNTYPCKLYATRTIEMMGKAIWRHRIQENPSAAGAPPGTSLEELTALRSHKPPSWWEGAGCPSPRTPSPALGHSGLASPTPTPKLVPTPLSLPAENRQAQYPIQSFANRCLCWVIRAMSSNHRLIVIDAYDRNT